MTAPVESAEKFVGDFVRLLRAGIVDERDIITDLKKRDTAIRKTVFAECEKIAHRHKGAAAKRRREKFPHILRAASPEAQMEISAEERGEDIAAEIIARNITSKAKEMT